MYANVHWRHYRALQWTAILEDPCSFVRLLQRKNVSIFNLSIPIASGLCAPCISATFVPGKAYSRMYANFHWGTIGRCSGRTTLEDPCSFVRLLHRKKVSIFNSPTPLLLDYMHLALLQPLYRGRHTLECTRISIDGTIGRCSGRRHWKACTALCAFWTDKRFPFLNSPFP